MSSFNLPDLDSTVSYGAYNIALIITKLEGALMSSIVTVLVGTGTCCSSIGSEFLH